MPRRKFHKTLEDLLAGKEATPGETHISDALLAGQVTPEAYQRGIAARGPGEELSSREALALGLRERLGKADISPYPPATTGAESVIGGFTGAERPLRPLSAFREELTPEPGYDYDPEAEIEYEAENPYMEMSVTELRSWLADYQRMVEQGRARPLSNEEAKQIQAALERE
jgi:hypothetical protein